MAVLVFKLDRPPVMFDDRSPFPIMNGDLANDVMDAYERRIEQLTAVVNTYGELGRHGKS
jgi:hypothetical protein